MKDLKQSVYIIFNIVYPILVLGIVSYLISSFNMGVYEDAIAAISIAILLCIPYAVLMKFDRIAANWYFIAENFFFDCFYSNWKIPW